MKQWNLVLLYSLCFGQMLFGQTAFTIGAQTLCRTDTIQVPITVEYFSNIIGLQFALNWNASKVQLLEFDSDLFSNQDYVIQQNRLIVLWVGESTASFMDGDTLGILQLQVTAEVDSFMLQFDGRTEVGEQEENGEINAKVVNTTDGEIMFKPLTQIESFVQTDIRLYPNPFHTQSTIQFTLLRPDWIWLRLYDQSGRLCYIAQEWCGAGLQNWTIYADQIGTNGIYTYQLSSAKTTHSGQFILNN